MLSTPTPARPTARNFFARSSNSAVTFVALRTISASASTISAFSESFVVITTLQPGCSFSSCTPRSLILSATMTFIRLRHCRRVFPRAVEVIQSSGTIARCQITTAAIAPRCAEPFVRERFLGLLYSMERGAEDESCGKNSEGPGRRHAGQRGAKTQRPARNKGGHQTQRSRKNTRARRRGVHSDSPNTCKTAQGVDRAVHQGQPPGTRRQRNQGARHHRIVSARRSQRSRNGRGHRQGHLRIRREFHQADGRGRESRKGGP